MVKDKEEDMLKVRFFVNEPNGKTWKHFNEIIPGLGEKYDIEIETISKPRDEYQSEAYSKLNLPVAPAIMVGETVLVEKSDIANEKLESAICESLGLPPPKPKKKGILSRLLNK